MSRKELTLRSLELFQACAAKGALQDVAREKGLALSTVAHHVRALEAHLGTPLFVEGKRPLMLTPVGRAFLRDIEAPLCALRRAAAEAASGNLAEARYLRLGTIEDFEGDVIPKLAVDLSTRMPRSAFTFLTESSHRIVELLHQRALELGITVTHTEKLGDLQARPLLRDPFVLVAPEGAGPAQEILAGQAGLPFLRFSGQLFIARQIESQLRRLGQVPAHGFECSNNQTLMAMVAAGAGWTITTALLFSRARPVGGLALHPFPASAFARTLSLVATPDCAGSVTDLVEARLRALIAEDAIGPVCAEVPWLEGAFALVARGP